MVSLQGRGITEQLAKPFSPWSFSSLSFFGGAECGAHRPAHVRRAPDIQLLSCLHFLTCIDEFFETGVLLCVEAACDSIFLSLPPFGYRVQDLPLLPRLVFKPWVQLISHCSWDCRTTWFLFCFPVFCFSSSEGLTIYLPLASLELRDSWVLLGLPPSLAGLKLSQSSWLTPTVLRL